MPFEPSRAAGLERLAAFVPKAGRAYAEGRNTDFGPGRPSAVSQLSPWLRYRLVSEQEVCAAVLERHALAALAMITAVTPARSGPSSPRTAAHCCCTRDERAARAGPGAR